MSSLTAEPVTEWERRAWQEVQELREQIGAQREQIEHLRRIYAAAVTRAEQAQENLRRLTVERNQIADERIRLALRLDDAAEMLEALPDVLADLIADSLEMIREQVKR